MEAKLNSYRSQKRRQAILNTFKDRLYNMVSFQQVRVDEKSTHVIVEADTEPQPKSKSPITPVHQSKIAPTTHSKKPRPVSESDSVVSIGSTGSSIDADQSTPSSQHAKPPRRSYLTYITYLVYFLFWVTLYAIAIELRFGVVFLMISALVGIYFNTRTEKEPGEISAYSVFNENCEAIDGTLKAEQFEREIGIRH
ncbi:SAYSvFN domain-containing protein 1 [Aedes albopictus]|uniref:SAYSvFN domain-containing protein n=1 Tax=Aedes albopictus TaxID=7160 RepID=A0ABM1ZK45_AEDAL|nr:SAYSvFN domain-containing protein 1-like [Aedes albopictus]XP_029722885.1 SAYSvFN domain-containing protein 1-like [Aedes albopictus]